MPSRTKESNGQNQRTCGGVPAPGAGDVGRPKTKDAPVVQC